MFHIFWAFTSNFCQFVERIVCLSKVTIWSAVLFRNLFFLKERNSLQSCLKALLASDDRQQWVRVQMCLCNLYGKWLVSQVDYIRQWPLERTLKARRVIISVRLRWATWLMCHAACPCSHIGWTITSGVTWQLHAPHAHHVTRMWVNISCSVSGSRMWWMMFHGFTKLPKTEKKSIKGAVRKIYVIRRPTSIRKWK